MQARALIEKIPAFGAVILTVVLLAAAGGSQAGKDFSPAPYYAPERSLIVDGAEICYLDAGSGEPLILVHGWAGNAWNWLSVFEPLSAKRRVIVLDLPGHGKSGCPEGMSYTVQGYADFIVRFMDRLELDKATLVGSSMGGAVAAWTAILHPERVERLVLVDAAGTSEQNRLMKLAGLVMTPATVIPMIHTVFPVNEKTLAAVPESERRRVELAELLYQSDRKKCASRALAKSMKSLGRQVADDRLSEVRAPALVIWGSDDPLLPLSAGKLYQSLLPNARLAVIQGGSHTPMQWKTGEFIQVLEKFLDQNPVEK